MLFSLIPKKYILILGAVAALCVVIYFWRAEIYRAAENAMQAAINQDIIRITEERNAIANNRPDDAATIKRLQDGTF